MLPEQNKVSVFDQTTEKYIECSTKITGNIAAADLEKLLGLSLYLKAELMLPTLFLTNVSLNCS